MSEPIYCFNCNTILSGCQKKYCSHSCAAQVNNHKYPKRQAPKNNKCAYCDNETNHLKKFCSQKCVSKNRISETHKKVANGTCIIINKIKRYLIEINGHECTNCNMTEWLGQPIPLEIDHIDGDSTNNSLDNFRILCPNCHAQTPTYRGLNIKNPLVKNMKQTRYQKYQKTSKV